MGYYCSFSLETFGSTPIINLLIKESVEEASGYSWNPEDSKNPDKNNSWYSDGEIKWYDSEDWLEKISAEYPEVYFVLAREAGIEDMSHLHAKNGILKQYSIKYSYGDEKILFGLSVNKFRPEPKKKE